MTPWAEAMPETTTRMAAMMAMRSTSSYSSAMSSTSIGPRNAAARAAAPSFASSGLGVGSGRETMVVDLGRRPIGVQELSGSVFNVPVRLDILHRCVRYLRAKWQQGTHKAKTRAEVRVHARTHARSHACIAALCSSMSFVEERSSPNVSNAPCACMCAGRSDACVTGTWDRTRVFCQIFMQSKAPSFNMWNPIHCMGLTPSLICGIH